SRYSLRGAQAPGSSYSSFNMGAGEDVVIELLFELQSVPAGSLVVIEEVELGLHPEALRRFARHLLEIMWAKKLQVVASTHIHHFLDAIPRSARVLIQRQGAIHEAVMGPTARYATGIMSGVSDPELHIYCEDPMAERVIAAALTPELRRRVAIL